MNNDPANAAIMGDQETPVKSYSKNIPAKSITPNT